MKCHSCGADSGPGVAVCPKCGLTQSTQVVPGAGFNRDVTRYLCAALQTDAGLNHYAYKKILREHYRAIASSPGVDLVTVLKYGLAARGRQLTRDALLVVFLLIGVAFLGNENPRGVLLALFAGWAVTVVESWVAHYGVLAEHLRRNTFNPAGASAPASERMRARLEAIAEHNLGNTTVHTDYGPFAGYGIPFENWSFTLNIATPVEDEEVIEFTTAELNDFVANAVRGVGLPGVHVDDRVFVSGQDLLYGLDSSVKKAILPNELAAPASRIGEAEIARLREDSLSRARPYLVIRVAGWNGELVVTMFLRLAMMPRKDQLYVEMNYSLLLPIQERYKQVDRLLSTPTGTQIFRMLGSSLVKLAPTTVGAFVRIVDVVFSPLEELLSRVREARAIKYDRSFNYGAATSLREKAADGRFHRHFQNLDKEMYAKVAERKVVEALEEFLDDHNIDTSDLRERQTTILNNGVYVSGQGSVNAGSLAVGSNAIANTFARARNTLSGPGAAAQSRKK